VRVAHFDCFSGISGDMVLGAVLHAGVPVEVIRRGLDSLGLPITLEVETVKRCGFAAIKATIHAADQEDYRFLPDIQAILAKADVTPRQRELAETIFRKVAFAEATAHGMPLDRVHFHEVGALDSIADIIGSAIGLDALGVERFTSSPVAVGSGTMKCAHGIMPVPTPGTAELLRGVPIAKCPVRGELATPTGVAILTSVVREYVDTPTMTIERIGHGAGTKDPIEQPNIVRLLVGTTPDVASESDTVVVLETNLDDCPGEWIGYAIERLFAAGALDVYTQAIQMKKQRPGVLLSVIAEPVSVAELEVILFRETGTFGVRRSTMQRSKLARESIVVRTPWGDVRAKRGSRGEWSIVTPEYDDCARVAREANVPLHVVYEAVRRPSSD
jgi:pyridinium-3,5-bisthiocarboxylic acid mononucleotide nickel chelatase